MSNTLAIYMCTVKGKTKYAPLYVHVIKQEQYSGAVEVVVVPEADASVADKLRYYRRQCRLRQVDVAAAIGIDTGTYLRWERGISVYPLDKLGVAAALFGVAVVDLLDSYHRFLYDGQAEQIRELRKANRLSRPALARVLGVHHGTVKRWETGFTTLLKENYVGISRQYLEI